MSDCTSTPLQAWPLSENIKARIALVVFGNPDPGQDVYARQSGLAPYFDYYRAQIEIALHERGRHVSVRSHGDILGIVELLKQSMTRANVLDHLKNTSSHTARESSIETLGNSIDFAVRLLTMIEVGRIPNIYTGRDPLFWQSGALRDFLKVNLSSQGDLQDERVKLESLFRASNLYRIAHMNIRWTSNLRDHLQMEGDDSEVAIFTGISFLLNSRNK